MAQSIVSALADWLYPRRCAGCGRVGALWCDSCQAQTHKLLAPLCSHCGYPLSDPHAECPQCMPPQFAFVSARAWGRYEGSLRRAILKLKHKPNRPLGAALATPLAEVYPSSWRTQVVVPVPLSAGRARQRGYNQVELLAAPLAQVLGLPVHVWLQRQRDTLPQMDLQFEQRWANVNNAFVASPQVAGQRVLLLDDIMTTGATLHACARALRAAGAHSVYALTLSRAM